MQRLEETESRYRALFEQTRDSVLLLELVPGRTPIVRDINAAALKALGYARGEIVGGPVSLISEEAAAGAPAIWERVGPAAAEGPGFELRHKRKDGSVFFAEASARQLSAGGKRFALLVERDITESRRAEADRERLTTAIEQAGDIVFVTDQEGTIQYVNPAFEAVTGYGRAEAVGKKPSILKSGRHDAAFYRDLWVTVSSGVTWKKRMVNRRKDGTLYTEEATISPVRGPDGRITNYVAVKRDITEQLSLESQFRQSQKMETVGLLAGGVAHDFNNILSAIMCYAGILARSITPGDPKLEDVKEIMAAAERAGALTNQLLAFSRRQIMAPRVVDINGLVGSMTRMLDRIVGENVKLEVRLHPEPCLANVDPGQIEQVIMNLALNARDAIAASGSGDGPGSGTMTLATEIIRPREEFFFERPELPIGRLVCLKVNDTGFGMNESVKNCIFEPFFTTKEQGKGTGLGLPVVFGIVKQSRGEIEVQSEPGKGSCFCIYLPFAETPPRFKDQRGPGAGARPAPPARVKAQATVLLVEDEESLRRLGARILRAAGYTVLVAQDGQEALRLMQERGAPADLLLTDVVMPGMSGRELALELARRRLVVRALYMSGYTGEAIVKHGVLEPGIAFIYKPFTVDTLMAKVQEVLAGPEDRARP